jgi:flagellar biosynthesis/type III secretory pathway M-ring protein FliF/YscJ
MTCSQKKNVKILSNTSRSTQEKSLSRAEVFELQKRLIELTSQHPKKAATILTQWIKEEICPNRKKDKRRA